LAQKLYVEVAWLTVIYVRVIVANKLFFGKVKSKKRMKTLDKIY